MLNQTWYNLVRFGFRLLYNEMAWTYDLVSWGVSLGAWQVWGRAVLPFVWGKQVLEIGHGPGHLLKALESADFCPVGLDLSPYMGGLAQKRTSAPLVRGKVQTLPFMSGVFETVLSTFPTDYIVDPATLAEVYRVLKENGRFLIVPEGHLTGTGLPHRFIDWLFRITGQRSGPFAVDQERWLDEVVWQPFKARFETAGFVIHIHHVVLEGSAVTVIVAEK